LIESKSGLGTNTLSGQDDVSVIGKTTNSFGYRADDHGNSAALASVLTVTGTRLSGSIVATTSDLDYLSFATGAGQIPVTVDVMGRTANLDLRIELRVRRALVTSADPATRSGRRPTTVAAGTCYLVVTSRRIR
jgi:hypothetical protein